MAGLAETLAENQRLRDLLVATAAERDRLVAEHKAALALAEQKLEAVASHAEDLERELARFRRALTAPKSERVTSSGPWLPFPNLLVPADPPEGEDKRSFTPPGPKGPRQKPASPPRRRDLSALPFPVRVVTLSAPADAGCARCQAPLGRIGESVTRRVGWAPGHFEVVEVHRDKVACAHCPGEGVLSPPSPFLLPKAMCANSLLARVLVDKFGDHLPLHRQAARMAREGFEVDTLTLSSWVIAAMATLRPLVDAIRKQVLAAPVIQADDTGLPVQDGTDGQLRKGRLWVFTDREHAFYAFTATKQGVHPAGILSGYQGRVVLVDGGSEFNAATTGRTRAGCWSHLRRYFVEAAEAHPAESGLAIDVMRDLFLWERDWATLPPEERLARRQGQARPVVDRLYAWINAMSQTVRPKSALGAAVTYARNQEAELRVYLSDPAVPLHNNLSELMLRAPVVGLKNWLFAGSEGGALAAADAFTLISSCRLQGIDPHAYLVDVMARLAEHPANRLEELTPKGWRELREG